MSIAPATRLARLRDNTALHLILLTALGIAVFLPELNQRKWVDGREGRHAEIAREMAETGQYLVPQSMGIPYTEKPPLFNWVVAGLFQLSGHVNFEIARLPSALAAVAAVRALSPKILVIESLSLAKDKMTRVTLVTDAVPACGAEKWRAETPIEHLE